MAYTQFDDDLPVITNSGAQTVTDIRTNQQAMRDMIVADMAVGWEMIVTVGTGSNEQPQYIRYNNNANTDEWIEEEITWGTTSGATNNPEIIVYKFSSDNEVIYDTIATLTVTYNTDGTVNRTDWT